MGRGKPPSNVASGAAANEVVIDSHVHVWDPTRVNYSWMADTPRLERRYDLGDVADEHRAAGVVAVVLVQAEDDIADTELMLEIAAEDQRVAGVVAWVPLLDPTAAEAQLDRWVGRPIVGARHLIHRDPNPDLLADPRIDDVMTLLAERHLTFDVCAESVHLLRLVPDLAERHPSLVLVIDHLAKPPIATRGWQPWAQLLADAAAAPNTVVKLSGLNTAALGGGSAADYRRYVDHALEVFGPERIMYGGDWPFALLAADSYNDIWRDLRESLDELDDADLAAVLARTAQRVYGLSVPLVDSPGSGGDEAKAQRQPGVSVAGDV